MTRIKLILFLYIPSATVGMKSIAGKPIGAIETAIAQSALHYAMAITLKQIYFA